MSTPQEPTSYQAAVQILATAAHVAVGFGVTPEEAVTLVATNTLKDARDARTRGGRWARESTTQQIEEACFLGVVASDVLDGTVSRPSTGNVRDAVLAAVREVAA